MTGQPFAVNAGAIKAPAPPVLDVGSLTSQLHAGALSAPLRIKGTSVAAEVWKKNPHYCFGTLAEGKARLRYRVPASSMPRVGEDVILAGALYLSPFNFELQFHGDVESAWQPKQRLARLRIPDRARTPVPLVDFLEHHAAEELGFIATANGWSDLERAVRSGLDRCAKEIAGFGDEDDVIAAVDRLCQERHVKAIVLARGGGARLDEVGNSDKLAVALINRKLPFYTALGHANDQLLLDKYADDSFSTPSDFGHRLRAALDHHAVQRSLQDDVDRLGRTNTDLRNVAAGSARDLTTAEENMRLLRDQLAAKTAAAKWMVGALVVLAGVVAVLLGATLVH
ncbi:exodeoxyribonuclease VII large subunit [Dyella jiangningensis]|uniref:exodeoxyribonuclease VII large subunit n=1 Tax=Dyella jiangningensis TaxID=1379159 RepID=UPI00240FA860|nr:exodeoxyribonuclease VII large subunit [Dyella jiangningensis]MDG2536996.1 exodeoxyribonuclease VII large subunit [Dyella jiangningensis]